MPSANRIIRGADWAVALRARLPLPPADMSIWMEQNTRLLKSDTYSRVGLLELQQQSCLLKLYLAKSPLQNLGFRLGYGRGIRSFDAALQLLNSNVTVPAPRACLLVPGGMVLLTEGIAEGRDLRALCSDAPSLAQARQFMQCAGETLAELHRAGFAHGDCKWSNLLWSGEKFLLVDLEAVRAVRPDCATRPPPARQLRDLARFTVDAEELRVGQEQYDVFIQSYCAAMDFPRELFNSAVRPHAELVRKRHREKYGGECQPLI